MSGGRDILVIDDESVILEAARRILEAEGFTVDRAADEETARRKVDEIDYRVVLCDLMLPGVRGFELVGRIQERLPQTPVILITGFATLENEVNGFQHGVFDFIPKPFDVAELLGVVQRGLGFADATRSGARMSSPDAWPHEALSAGAAPTNAYTLGGHAWAIVESDGRVRIGLGRTFAALGSGFEQVELPAVGDDALQGNRIVRIVTRDQLVHRVWAPLSGQVIETDDRALDDPSAICRNWLITLMPSDLEGELPRLTRL
jgi:CheY-like chemotaxis protein